MLVIFNPVAGRRRATALWRVLDLLVENGVKIEVAETQHAGHATDLARQAAREGAFMVVAAGGDGTIAEVANGLIGTDTALGIIPLGTANVLAKEYGLSTHPRGIANTLAYKRCKPLWPGVAQLPGRACVRADAGAGLRWRGGEGCAAAAQARHRQGGLCLAVGLGIRGL
ncbi:acylglycerol kinase family protein [Acidocella sp. MX-AZ03]|uniref:diacylglycerol/lipid kinase family protein n=1 Tax=Acidocella sp. MX-AZ03 TaxID=2697363 RepID=UPI0022DDD9D6|nr:acylglycerol kinase family protein [Acidocella sp. MX-AZ03]WBO58858.1 acylglycerol kinase family protein [Acidocella sp. MX-AZ03]